MLTQAAGVNPNTNAGLAIGLGATGVETLSKVANFFKSNSKTEDKPKSKEVDGELVKEKEDIIDAEIITPKQISQKNPALPGNNPRLIEN